MDIKWAQAASAGEGRNPVTSGLKDAIGYPEMAFRWWLAWILAQSLKRATSSRMSSTEPELGAGSAREHALQHLYDLRKKGNHLVVGLPARTSYLTDWNVSEVRGEGQFHGVGR